MIHKENNLDMLHFLQLGRWDNDSLWDWLGYDGGSLPRGALERRNIVINLWINHMHRMCLKDGNVHIIINQIIIIAEALNIIRDYCHRLKSIIQNTCSEFLINFGIPENMHSLTFYLICFNPPYSKSQFLIRISLSYTIMSYLCTFL